MGKKIIATVWIFFLSILLIHSVPAAPQENLVLILDGSGSMWGTLNGKAKIEVARQVIRKLTKQLPSGSKLGLIAYGHRRQNDCRDIETLLPPGSSDPNQVPVLVDRLKPLGKTPLTASLQQAIAESKKVGRPGTVVLVTDGLETCGGDPCATVRQAKQAGVDFVLHIVGFDVAKENVLSLECSAQAGGGLYFPAENADQLFSALEQTMTATQPTGDAKLSVKSIRNGQLHDSMVTVLDSSGQRIAAGRTYSSDSTNPRLFPLEAGAYQVVVKPLSVQGVPEKKFTKIQLQSGKTTEKIADFSTGQLSVLVTRNGELSDAVIRVYPSGSQKPVASGRSYRSQNSNPRVFQLAPGTYEVTVGSVELKGGAEHRFQNVTISGNQPTELKHSFNSGTLKIGAVQGSQLIDATTTVKDSTGKTVASRRTYTNPKRNPATFVLPPGSYTVSVKPVRQPKAEAKTISVEVTQGGNTEKILDFKP